MKISVVLVATVALFLGSTNHNSHAQASTPHIPCPGNGIVDHIQIQENAALAELAYEAAGPNTYPINILSHCADSSLRHDSRGYREVKVRQIPDRQLREAEERLNQRFDDNGPGSIEVRTIEHNGVNYHVCDRGMSPNVHLAVAFRWMLLGSKLELGYTVGFVAGGMLAGQEEIQALSLFDDHVLGVPGTDMDRRRQWVTSLNDMVEHSCIFDFSAEVTRSVLDCFAQTADCSIEGIHQADELILVGHSLGGAISQHAADTQHRANLLGPSGNQVRLRAYSFNSMGMNNPVTCQPHHHDINSITLAGELLEVVVPDTTQIGKFIRYDTMNWVLPTEWVHRHKLATVQETICGCTIGNEEYFQFREPNC